MKIFRKKREFNRMDPSVFVFHSMQSWIPQTPDYSLSLIRGRPVKVLTLGSSQIYPSPAPISDAMLSIQFQGSSN